MEAKLVDELPEGSNWQFEPKWDGFRCLIFRDGEDVELQSKAERPLGRYFPEIVEAIRSLGADRFVIDGEIIIRIGDILSFDALQLRLHPAESRIRKLAAQTPAQLMLFDCLEHKDNVLTGEPLSIRRKALERFHAATSRSDILLSPATADLGSALAWLAAGGGALDGVIAKPLDAAYQPGERAMLKVKQRRSADCVVGGFRYGAKDRLVASLLLGLYDDEGRLNHVGFTSAIPAGEREPLTERLEKLVEPPGFTGRAPGGPSRWSNGRSADWQPLRHELVVEVSYDQVTGERFRHGTRLLRWRPDKAPRQCRMEQLQPERLPAQLTTLEKGRK